MVGAQVLRAQSPVLRCLRPKAQVLPARARKKERLARVGPQVLRAQAVYLHCVRPKVQVPHAQANRNQLMNRPRQPQPAADRSITCVTPPSPVELTGDRHHQNEVRRTSGAR